MITISLLFCLFQERIGSSIRFFFVFYAVIICWRSDSTAGTHWRSQTLLSLFIGEQYKISVQEQYKIHDPCSYFCSNYSFPPKKNHFFHAWELPKIQRPKSPFSLPAAQLRLALCLNAPPIRRKKMKQMGVAWRIQLGSTTSLEATVRINILDHWFCKNYSIWIGANSCPTTVWLRSVPVNWLLKSVWDWVWKGYSLQ